MRRDHEDDENDGAQEDNKGAMKMKNFDFKKILGIAIYGLAAITYFGNAHAGIKTAKSYEVLPFPIKFKKFETEIFRLIDSSYSVDPQTKKSYYDQKFSKQFEDTIKNFSDLDKRLKKKLLSGPAPQGKYIRIGNAHYIFYTICQAHWCNVTNISILYQPEEQRMVGRLLYACDKHEFGDMNKEEIQVINEIAPISIDDDDCKFAKAQK
jgi:hypothetical protein